MTSHFESVLSVHLFSTGQFLVELLMFAFLVGALHGVGLCPVKSSNAGVSTPMPLNFLQLTCESGRCLQCPFSGNLSMLSFQKYVNGEEWSFWDYYTVRFYPEHTSSG